jgi:hypothetical protein
LKRHVRTTADASIGYFALLTALIFPPLHIAYAQQNLAQRVGQKFPTFGHDLTSA